MGCRLFGILPAALAMALALALGDQALSSSQTQETDVTKKPELRATPLTPTETLQAPREQSAAQPMPTNRVRRRMATQAMADLAQRLALPLERVEFLEWRSMLWPDGGLGCPRPGMIYPQVQQEGYLIRLRAGKREFDYHGGSRRGPFLCEKKSG